MGTEETVTVDLFSAEFIAFYVWVFGVAIVGTWKEAGTVGSLELAFMMLGNIILAMVVAIAIWYWVGASGVIALAAIFVVCFIRSVYLLIKKL
jgi:hypothetical protein